MAQRFRIPTISRRHASLGLAVLVLLAGAAYLLTYPNCCAPKPEPVTVPMPAALQDFRNGCMKSARHANGGGDLVMDDATEAKIGAYCGCVADALVGNVAPAEIAKIGLPLFDQRSRNRCDQVCMMWKQRL